MRHPIMLSVLLILLVVIFLPVTASAQVLLKLSPASLPAIEESQILWKEAKGSSAFALIADDDIMNLNVPYQILDSEVKSEKFFWLHAKGVTSYDWNVLIPFTEIKLLWSDALTALVKFSGDNIRKTVPVKLMVQPVIFEKHAVAPVDQLLPVSGWTVEDIRSVQFLVDSVNIDSIYYTERHLTGINPFYLSTGIDSIQSRHSYNPQIFKAQQYLKERLENYGYTVNLPSFNLSGNILYNIEAVKMGTEYQNHYYVICAHYDDMPSGSIAPGADDNGSGTAAVIEAARLLKDLDFKFSIRFVLFAGEEQGLWGSQAYAQAAANAGDLIQGVLNMDMIGYDSNNDGRMEIHAGTLPGSQEMANLMQMNITTLGLALTADYHTSGSSTASDHASFWNVGYSALMHIEDFQDFTPHYHTTNDRLPTLNVPYFRENAKLAIGTLAVLAVMDSVTTGIVPDQLPEGFQLADPYPNPFNPTVTIKYHLPATQNVQVQVFDILGKPVKRLVNTRQGGGWHQIVWDSTNEYGSASASGIYFIQVRTESQVQLRKMMLIR